MTTIIEKLDPESWEALHSLCMSAYLDGQCYEFALALHRLTYWPIVALMKGPVLRHAVVRKNEQEFYDVRGRVTFEELGSPFGMEPPHELHVVEKRDLQGVRPINDRSISMAQKMVEMLWPDLPRRHDHGFRGQARAFTDELEHLSRKHGIWIRSMVPGSPPMLATFDGTEGGYRLTPTADGQTYSIDRYFET